MKIQSISPSFTGKISVPANGNNKNVYLLYNKVANIVKENQVTAEFRTKSIEISPHSSARENIKTALKNLGIEFTDPDAKKETLLDKAHKIISSCIPE